jgi:hypothetical protein
MPKIVSAMGTHIANDFYEVLKRHRYFAVVVPVCSKKKLKKLTPIIPIGFAIGIPRKPGSSGYKSGGGSSPEMV